MNIDAIRAAGDAPVSAPAPVHMIDRAEQRELIQAVKAVNGAELFGAGSELTFAVDRETKRPVVRIVDRKTNELIQQIPPEYVLRLAQDLRGADR